MEYNLQTNYSDKCFGFKIKIDDTYYVPPIKHEPINEKYPCPKCGSTNIDHTWTESDCNDCDYNSKIDD